MAAHRLSRGLARLHDHRVRAVGAAGVSEEGRVVDVDVGIVVDVDLLARTLAREGRLRILPRPVALRQEGVAILCVQSGPEPRVLTLVSRVGDRGVA